MIRSIAVAILLAGLAAGCADRPSKTLYDRLGGGGAIAAVVDDFIANVAADPAINRRFAGADLAQVKRSLVELICEDSGGPCRYPGRSLKDVHRGMAIRDAEFDAMAADLARTLDKFRVPVREKAELLALIGSTRSDVVGR